MLSLNSVSSIARTKEDGVFLVSCNITDLNGETYDCEYCSRSDDTFGLNPTIRKWLEDNPDFPIDPYVPPAPPTAEELRERMEPLSPRQLRLALVRSGTSLASVEAAIAALPDGTAKEEAKIEWEYATVFERLAPALLTIADAIGLTPEAVDELWEQALTI